MKTPLYRQAITHGWNLAIKDKWLWIFGLFAALLGQFGIVDFLTKTSLAVNDANNYLTDVGVFNFGTESLVQTAKVALDTRFLILWLLVLLFVLGIGLLFAAIVSQGAIVNANSQFLKSKKNPDLGKAWHEGVRHFWKLFAINFFKKALIVVLAIVVSASAYMAIQNPAISTNSLFLLTFLLASVVGLVASFLAVYAAGYVVVEDYPFLQSLEAAWKLFTSHWLVSLEVGLIILIFNILAALSLFVGFVAFFLPALIVWLVAIMVGSQALIWVGFIMGFLLFAAFIMILGAFFTVFTTSVWTYLFVKMHKTGIKSRIIHWLGHS